MKFLIVGRTGTGKDKLRRILQQKYGWKFVCSHTTRARRPGETDTHIFISKEEAAKIPSEDKVAVTFLKNGDEENEYFTTRKQVEDADAYIIDPNGINVLLKNMPDEIFEICYVSADKEKAKEMAILRADGDVEAGNIYDKRYESEDEQFSHFEKQIGELTFGAENCKVVSPCFNDYSEDVLEAQAWELNCRKKLYQDLQLVISDLKEKQTFNLDDNGNILVCTKKENGDGFEYQAEHDEKFIQTILTDPEGFRICMTRWIGFSTSILTHQNMLKCEETPETDGIE